MRGFVVACWVVLALLGSARAEEPATTSTSAAPTAPAAPAAAAPVVQETTVRGTPPDLAGRWLAVTWIELGQDTIRNVATPWDITERDGRLQLTELFVELAVVKEAIDKANAERAAWRPTREELARVLASWDQLPPVEPHLARVRHEISARGGAVSEVVHEERVADDRRRRVRAKGREGGDRRVVDCPVVVDEVRAPREQARAHREGAVPERAARQAVIDAVHLRRHPAEVDEPHPRHAAAREVRAQPEQLLAPVEVRVDEPPPARVGGAGERVHVGEVWWGCGRGGQRG